MSIEDGNLTDIFNQLNPYGSGGSNIDTTYGQGGIGGGGGGGGNDFSGIANTISAVGGQMSAAPGAASAQGASSQDLEKYFAEVSGYNRWALKQQLAQQKKNLDFQYKQLAAQTHNAQDRLKLDRWYQHSQIDLLQQTHDLDVQKQQDVEKQFAQTFGLQQQQFEAAKQQFAQQQGLDILKTQASLAGPANFVQSANYAAGIAGDPSYAGFVNSLVNGQNSRLFGPAAAGYTPQPLTMGSLAGLTTGAGGTAPTAAAAMAGGNDLQQRLAQAQSLTSGAQQLAQQGGGALGAQSLEALSPTEKGLLQSGFGGAGQDFGSFLQAYRNSRVGQGQALAA